MSLLSSFVSPESRRVIMMLQCGNNAIDAQGLPEVMMLNSTSGILSVAVITASSTETVLSACVNVGEDSVTLTDGRQTSFRPGVDASIEFIHIQLQDGFCVSDLEVKDKRAAANSVVLDHDGRVGVFPCSFEVLP